MTRPKRIQLCLFLLICIDLLGFFMLFLFTYCETITAGTQYTEECQHGLLNFASSTAEGSTLTPPVPERSINPMGVIYTFLALLMLVFANFYAYAIASQKWRSLNHCDQCGYNIQNLPAEVERCPECGNKIDRVYAGM